MIFIVFGKKGLLSDYSGNGGIKKVQLKMTTIQNLLYFFSRSKILKILPIIKLLCLQVASPSLALSKDGNESLTGMKQEVLCDMRAAKFLLITAKLISFLFFVCNKNLKWDNDFCNTSKYCSCFDVFDVFSQYFLLLLLNHV